jgi:putative oxidoreductase
MNALLTKIDQILAKPELGKLILRVSFSLLFLLHGIHKIFGGTAFIQSMLIERGLPGFIAYGVYVGEVIVPIAIILGLYTRQAAIIFIGTCLMITWLMHPNDLWALNKFGAWAVEDIGVYLFAALSILFLGSGKYAIKPSH